MKKCNFCGEQIQDEAMKCRYCGEWLNKESQVSATSTVLSELKFPKIRPGYMMGSVYLIFEILKIIIGPMVAVTIALVAIMLMGLLYWCISLHKLHQNILKMADNQYPISAAQAVGFQFIPFYNFYWIFKWPKEVIDFINTRDKSRRLNTWLPGLVLLLSSMLSFFIGAIGFIGSFSVLWYLINSLKRSLAVQPHPLPYKVKTTLFSAWTIVVLIGVLLLLIGVIVIRISSMAAKAKIEAKRAACIANFKAISMAKEMWAADSGEERNKVPTWSDLMPYLNKKPVCPAGGTYEIRDIDSAPTCSIGDNGTKTSSDDHIVPGYSPPYGN